MAMMTKGSVLPPNEEYDSVIEYPVGSGELPVEDKAPVSATRGTFTDMNENSNLPDEVTEEVDWSIYASTEVSKIMDSLSADIIPLDPDVHPTTDVTMPTSPVSYEVLLETEWVIQSVDAKLSLHLLLQDKAVTFAVVSPFSTKSEAKPANETLESAHEKKEDVPVKTSPPKFLQKLFD